MASLARIVATIISLHCISQMVRGMPDETVVQQICSGDKYNEGDDYYFCLCGLLRDMRIHTADSGYNYYGHNAVFNFRCYGHAACNGTIADYDCTRCLEQAHDVLLSECSGIGAQLQLKDCRMRYEMYSFTE